MNPTTTLLLHFQKMRDNVNNGVRKALRSFIKATEAKMKAADFSRSEIAERLHVSRPFVTKVLSGEANITVETMVKFAQALDCDLSIELRQRKKLDVGDPWIQQEIADDPMFAHFTNHQEGTPSRVEHGGRVPFSQVTVPMAA